MTDDARASGFTFFLDRGLGSRIVPQALREAGWVLETMDERYGADASQRIADVQWIEEATIRGDILLCKDLAITRNLVEARVIYTSGARIFALANARMVGKEMAAAFLGNEAQIVHVVRRVIEPFVFAVGHEGLRRARLRYPVDGA
ncbi:hypothetical protein ACIBK9_00555 [Nonomuraea sp. NPDC050227]|uniref:PIN-like domain-containing protein n=1 Tax=Nonomuraea sp. NPDC050227 TaxID=3364360 RepID=UPI0037B574C4